MILGKPMRSAQPRRPAAASAAALLIAALLATTPGLAWADNPTPTPPADEASPGRDQIESFEAERIYLDAEGFRALFEGKTVHLSDGDRHYGSEYYKKGDRSVWVAAERPCKPGVWYFQQQHFCFQYENDGPYCWKVFQRGENFYAESTDGFELRIYAVDEKPLSCAPELLS